MYNVGYLNRTVSAEKYAYLVRTVQSYDGFLIRLFKGCI